MKENKKKLRVMKCPFCGKKIYFNGFVWKLPAHKTHSYDHLKEEIEELSGWYQK